MYNVVVSMEMAAKQAFAKLQNFVGSSANAKKNFTKVKF